MRSLAVLVVSLVLVGSASAQKANLVESPKSGECFKIGISTAVTGKLKVTANGKPAEVALEAKSEHAYFEKTLKEANGLTSKSARRYGTAHSVARVGGENIERKLRPDRTLIVAQRFNDQHLCYSPGGPLTRPEMEVASEHLESMHLTGMLPGKEVEIGDNWPLGNACVQSLCQFEGLIGHTLKGTFKEVVNGSAIVRIVGDANGVEAGAQVKLSIDATVEYDILNQRITKVTWNQIDERDQGPVSPIASLKGTVTLKREYLKDEPKELNAAMLIGIPSEDDPPLVLKLLTLKDTKGRYTLMHARDWHSVGQTDEYAILRLMSRGEFMAQATILPWEKMEAGKRIATEEFKKAVTDSKNWACEEVLDAGQISADDDRWIYRVVAKGDMDGIKVIQAFYIAVSPKGDHILVTFTTKAGNVNKLGTKDVELVNSIEFKK